MTRDPFNADVFGADPFNAEVFGSDNPPGDPFNNEVFGAGAVYGPMTEAESKAADKKAATKKWFTDPAWKDGPPRWQVGTAGGVVGVGVILLFSALFGRK